MNTPAISLERAIGAIAFFEGRLSDMEECDREAAKQDDPSGLIHPIYMSQLVGKYYRDAITVLRWYQERQDEAGVRVARDELELIHPEAGHLAHAEAYTKLESEKYALKAEVVTLKQEISGNDSAHRLLLAEVERLKKGNEMVNQLLGEMTGKRDALKARLAEWKGKANAIARENCEYQKQIRDLKAALAEQAPLVEAAMKEPQDMTAADEWAVERMRRAIIDAHNYRLEVRLHRSTAEVDDQLDHKALTYLRSRLSSLPEPR